MHLKNYLIAMIVLLTFVFTKGWSLYLTDNFSANNNWVLGLKYSLALGVWAGHQTVQNNGLETWSMVNNKLSFAGWVDTPVVAGPEYYGVYALFTNTNVTASEYNPFGFEITRVEMRNDSGSQAYRAHMFNISMVQANPGVTNYANTQTPMQQSGPNFNNTVTMSEAYYSYHYANCFVTWNQTAFPYGPAMVSDWSSVTNNAGGTANLQTVMNYNYSNSVTNTNYITYRVINDGNYLYVYVNPNKSQGTQNEFYFAGQYPVSFSNNLTPMIGLATLTFDRDGSGGTVAANDISTIRLSNFIIRSICSNVVSELAPVKIKAGSQVPLNIAVKPTFSTVNEAGVGEFYVDLPAGYAWTNAGFTNSLGIFIIGTNGAAYKNFTNNYSADSHPSTSNCVNITVKSINLNDYRRLKIRFNTNDYFHPDTLGGTVNAANAKTILLVVSNFTSLPAANAAGISIGAYVNNEKYLDTQWAKTATTGKMLSYAGNVLDFTMVNPNLIENNSMTLQSFDNQAGIGSVTPNILYEAQAKNFYYDLLGNNPSGNNADISRVEIWIPTNFVIDTGSLDDDRELTPSQLYISNVIINGTNVIRLDYPVNGGLVASGGRDTLRFNVLNTPAVPVGKSEITNYWPSYSYSALAGTIVSNNVTNSLFPSQMVIVRKKPPDAQATLTATNTGSIITNLIANTAVSNYFSFLLVNNGQDKNDIRKVRLVLGNEITNLLGLTTLLPSTNVITNTNGNYYIDIFYTNSGLLGVTSGIKSNDIITFKGFNNVQPLTNSVLKSSNYIYVDNYNGDGWMPVTNSLTNLDHWDVFYYTPPSQASAYIDTPVGENGDITVHNAFVDMGGTNVSLIVTNTGEKYNAISSLKIYLPTDITNVTSVLSYSNGSVLITNNGITNVVYIYYTNAGLLYPGTVDRIDIGFKDKVNAASNEYFQLESQNSSNYTGNYCGIPAFKNLTLSYIYSPVFADAYIDVPKSFISASMPNYTITNYIYNRGRQRNDINFAEIDFPPALLTNITSIGSLLQASNSYNNITGKLSLYYTNGIFPGQTNDLIYMTVWHINTNTNFNVQFNVSNDRWLTNSIASTPGYQQNIAIADYPTLYSYSVSPGIFYNSSTAVTNQIQIVISNRGWSDNKLQLIRIQPPQMFSGKIVSVSNSFLQATNTAAGPVKLSATNDIWINYAAAGTNILPDQLDTNYITFIIDKTNATNLSWVVGAQNNHTPGLTNLLSFIDGGTNITALVKKPYGYLSPNQVLITTAFNNFAYNVYDDGLNAGHKIKKIRIALPSVFNQLVNFSSTIPFTTFANYTANGSNYIEATYSSGLGSGGDQLHFTGYASVPDETNYSGLFEADYADGNGWRPSDTAAGFTNVINFKRPAVNGLTYVTPSTVYQDFPTNAYSFYVENAGEVGNNIQMVKIIAPAYITNCGSLVSTVKGAPVQVLPGNGVVTNVIYYTNSYVLSNGMSDWISLIGYNNYSTNTVTNGTWTVLGNNTTNAANETNLTVIIGQTLTNLVAQPGYAAEIGIVVTNSASGGFGTNIYTTLSTNYLEMFVYNQSQPGTWINSLKIKIPSAGSLLNTNAVMVSNLLKTGVTNYLSNDYIIVDYSSNQIRSQEMDEIFIQISDSINNINTNLTWSADASFNSTYNNYKPAVLYAGDTLSVYYTMPAARAWASALPNQTSEDFPTNAYQITYTNTGTEPNNNIYSMQIIVPDAITNITGVTNLNSSYQPFFVKGSNFITVLYTNNGYSQPLAAGDYDAVTFTGWSKVTNAPYSSNWTLYADNTSTGTFPQNVSTMNGGSLGFNVVRYPYTAKMYMEATNSVSIFQKNQIYSTVSTDYLVLYITNSTASSNNNLTMASIQIPWVVDTNSLVVSSLVRITGVTNYLSNNFIVMDYSASNIQYGQWDKVMIQFRDNVVNINTNAYWTNIQAAFNTTYNQFKPAVLWQGRSLTFNYNMPPANLQAYSYPNTMPQDFPTNHFRIFITNAASEPENTVFFVNITLPDAITNIAGIVHLNTNYSDGFITNSNSITVMYTNGGYTNGIQPGGFDTIDFIAYNKLNGASPDYYTNWLVYCDNTTNRTQSVAGTETSNGLSLSIVRYPYAAVMNIEATNFADAYGKNTLYSTVATNYLLLSITNTGGAGNNLTSARLKVPNLADTNSMVITNLIRTAGVTNYLSNGYIVFDYSSSNLSAGDSDQAYIQFVSKTMDINTNVNWNSDAAYDTTYNIYKPAGGNNGIAYVMPQANALGYSLPNRVSQDFPTNSYRLIITNAAVEERNNLYAVKIALPGAITNVLSISSTNADVVASYLQASNLLMVYYTNANYTKGLVPGGIDEIDFTGANAYTNSTYSSNFLVWADNTTNKTGWNSVGVLNGYSFNFCITNYAYAASVYAEITNSVSPSDKNSIFSTEITNFVMLTISNTSGSNENKIVTARISVPWVVDTNTLLVSNLNRNNVTNYLSNNYIVLDYSASNLLQGDCDVIYLRYADKVMNINTNAFWSVDAAYDTTYRLFKPALLWNGKSLAMNYVMPAASALAYSQPNRLSIDFPQTNYTIFVTNTSTNAGNNIFVVNLNVPPALTNITGLTNQNAGGRIVYSQASNTITVYYTNNNYTQGLAAGAFDTYNFTAFNSNSQPYYGSWLMTVDNTTNRNGLVNAGVAANAAFDLLITNFGYQSYAYLEATNSEDSINRNNIYSSVITNYIKLFITNASASNENRLVSARIGIPWTVDTNTLIVSNLSRNNVTASVSNSYIVLNYASSNLLQGESDVIFLQYADKVWNINTNANWSLDASYNTSYSLYKTVGVWPGNRLLSLAYDLPPVNTRGYTLPNTVSQDFPTNSISLFITNQAQEDFNSIYQLAVQVPAFITNITGLTNSNSNYSFTYSFITNLLTIYYTNNNYSSGIREGDWDALRFNANFIVTNANINTNWVIKAFNTTNNAQQGVVSALSGGSLALNVVQYPYMTWAYMEATNSVSVFERNKIYSTIPTDYIKLIITNKTTSAGNDITGVKIQIPNIVKTNTIQVTNFNISPAVGYSISNNYLVLDYSAGNIHLNEGDVVMISFDDLAMNTNLTAYWTNIGISYNTTYNSFKPVTLWSGKSLAFDYIMPSVKLNAGVSTNLMPQDFPTNQFAFAFTNTGTEPQNNIYQVKITVPDGFTNINGITHQNTNYNPVMNYAGNVINIYYTNNSLKTGDYDFLQFTAYSKFKGGDPDYYSNWNVLADNSTNGSALSQASPLLNGWGIGIVLYPYQSTIYLAATNGSTNLYSTAASNRFMLSVTNTSGQGGNNIYSVRVKIPGAGSLIDTNSFIISNLVKTAGVNNTVSNGYIVLDYSSNNIQTGQYDQVLIRFNNKLMNISTNINWQADAAFDSTYQLYKPSVGKTAFSFVMPAANAQGYANPNTLPEDYPSQSYTISVSNTGAEQDIDGSSAGNNIYVVRVKVPASVTNITGITNSNPSYTPVLVYSTNMLYAYYTNQNFGKGILEGDADQLSFTAQYGLLSGDVYDSWLVYADNTTNRTGEAAVSAISNNALSFNLKQYQYKVYADISSTTAVDGTNYSAVYSTVATNNIQLRLDNESTGLNNITNVKVVISNGAGFIDTSSFVLPANASKTVVGGDIVILMDYSTNPIPPSATVLVPIKYNDTIDYFETNIQWSVFVMMDKNSPFYRATDLPAGKSAALAYVMPKPFVSFSVTPPEVYLNRSVFTVQAVLSNKGTGSSDVDQMLVYLPSGLSVLTASNSIAGAAISTSISNGSNLIVVHYAQSNLLKAGSSDSYNIRVSQTLPSSMQLSLGTEARSFVKVNSTSGNKSILFSTVPSIGISPATVDSSVSVNYHQIFLDNGISGSRAVKNVILQLPPVITNYQLLSSRIPCNILYIPGLTNISGADYSNILFIDYSSNNGILQSQRDLLEFNFFDNLDIGSLNSSIGGWVNDEFGYVPMGLINNMSSNVYYNMPDTVTASAISPEKISLTTVNDTLSIQITNKGSGSSKLSFVKIDIPSSIVGINGVSSLYGGAAQYVNTFLTNYLLLDYTAHLLDAGASDVITFNYTNNTSAITNLLFTVSAANLTNNPKYTVSPGRLGNNLILQETYPLLAAEAYFYSDNKLYLMDNFNSLTYRLVNRTFNTELTQAVVTIDPYLFSGPSNSVSLKSSKPSAVITSNGNIFTISYPAGSGLTYSEVDDLEMDVTYYFSNVITNLPVTTVAWVHGDTNSSVNALAVGLNQSSIVITNMNWGGLAGTVIPGTKPVNVSLFYPGSATKATNSFGNVVSGATKNGDFLITKILPGTYDVEYFATYYKTTRIPNITVQSNVIVRLNPVTMKNALLAGNYPQLQEADCYQLTNTKIIFPGNSIDTAFSIDITRVPLTTVQVNQAAGSKIIKTPADTAGMMGYHFDLNNDSDNGLPGKLIQLDAIIYLAYDKAVDVDKRGWVEDDLAVYYWDDVGIAHWVMVGGDVDKANSLVAAKVGYVHNYYAVMAKNESGSDTFIRNVEVRPKVFTPTANSQGYFGNVRITFDLKEMVDKFSVKIFNLQGKMIRSYDKTGGYSQAEIGWDAKDSDGYPVKGGVYIYRILAGGNVYSGTIVLVR